MPFSSRTEKVIGPEGVAKLAECRVAVFGVGGVGGAVCEALARAGIGSLDLFDGDVVEVSNLNRQLVALRSNLGENKAVAMAQRIADINLACRVRTFTVFYSEQNAEEYPFDVYDYVVDAVDDVKAKVEIALRCQQAGVPMISSMGTGNKLHPEMLEIAKIEKTSVCPLAKAMRREFKLRGIKGVKVVYSKEQPVETYSNEEVSVTSTGRVKRNPPGSISFVPNAAGLLLAGAVVRDILGLV